jgi:hypothetical protein
MFCGVVALGSAWTALEVGLPSAWEQVGLLVGEPVCGEFARVAFGGNRHRRIPENSGGIQTKYRNLS